MNVFLFLSVMSVIVWSQDLFFSEYIEGSSYNKAVEIFNPVNSEIELTSYQIWKITKSTGTWTDDNGNGSYALDLSEFRMDCEG